MANKVVHYRFYTLHLERLSKVVEHLCMDYNILFLKTAARINSPGSRGVPVFFSLLDQKLIFS